MHTVLDVAFPHRKARVPCPADHRGLVCIFVVDTVDKVHRATAVLGDDSGSETVGQADQSDATVLGAGP